MSLLRRCLSSHSLFPFLFQLSVEMLFFSFFSFFSPCGTVAVGGLRQTTTSANVAGAPVVAKTCPKLSQNPFLHSLFRIDLFSQPGQRVAQPSDLLWGVGEAHNRQKNQLAHKNRKQHNRGEPQRTTTTPQHHHHFPLLRFRSVAIVRPFPGPFLETFDVRNVALLSTPVFSNTLVHFFASLPTAVWCTGMVNSLNLRHGSRERRRRRRTTTTTTRKGSERSNNGALTQPTRRGWCPRTLFQSSPRPICCSF